MKTATLEMPKLKAPFPWFGGKSRVAPIVWERFGDVKNYVEPFAGSLAVLLGRPHPPRIETVNDKDRYLANFWRAVAANPKAVAKHADWPVNEADLEARHYWLISEGREKLAKLLTRPDAYDAKIAGWWVWGLCSWIGGSWCSGQGPWIATDEGWTLLTAGQGANRQLPEMRPKGINRQLPEMRPKGINRTRPMVHGYGRGIHCANSNAAEMIYSLQRRLQRVRVCCGNWDRILGPSTTYKSALSAVFLDPPYLHSVRDAGLYGENDDGSVAADVRKWAAANGDNPLMRIALCGYEGEHKMPKRWTEVPWKSAGGYSSTSARDTQGKANRHRERIWFSPHCLTPD